MESKQSQKRRYTEEFKHEAVRLVTEGSHPEAQVARDLDVCRSLLGKWRRRIEEEAQNGQTGQRTFPGKGNPRDEELARLQRENARLKEENEIFKKAVMARERACVGIFTRRPLAPGEIPIHRGALPALLSGGAVPCAAGVGERLLRLALPSREPA